MMSTYNNRAHVAELLAAGQISSFFEIVDEGNDPHRCGYDGNAFATREEAEAAICDVRQLGEDWADVAWSVREVRQ
jgi:hypothetical protein